MGSGCCLRCGLPHGWEPVNYRLFKRDGIATVREEEVEVSGRSVRLWAAWTRDHGCADGFFTSEAAMLAVNAVLERGYWPTSSEQLVLVGAAK
jgi:hypothetical protein